MQQAVSLANDDDMIVVKLPNGQEVTVGWSDQDDGLLPELEIWLPEELCVNCWATGLKPAPAVDGAGSVDHVRVAVQLMIPIEHGYSDRVPDLYSRSVG